MPEQAKSKKASAMPRRNFLTLPLKSVVLAAPCWTLLDSRAFAGQAALCHCSKRGAPKLVVIKPREEAYRIRMNAVSVVLNLAPMNSQIAAEAGMKLDYAQMRSDADVLASPVSDLVGILGLQFDGMPRIPRICWDNREHHFWEGFEGTYEPRNVVVNAPRVEPARDDSAVRASYYYIANHVKTTVSWEFLTPISINEFVWNTTLTVENLTRKPLKNHFQFFACYHPPGTNYYWDAANEIKPCAGGGFNVVRGPEMERLLRSSPYHTHIDRYRGDREVIYAHYAQPVLISGKQEWFGGLRHVVLVEPKTCAALHTWFEQARDYMLCPPNLDLNPGEKFTARVRHVFGAVEALTDLKRLWTDFEKRVLS